MRDDMRFPTGRHRSPRLFTMIALGTLAIGLVVHLEAQTKSAPTPAAAPSNPAPADKPVSERLAALERDTTNNKQRLDDTFNVFLGLGGIATLGLLLFGSLTVYREYQQEQNYRRERDFYEERQRQERRDYRYERWIHERRDGRQARLEEARLAQDVQLGAKGVESFDKMVTAQINNVSGLAKVIELVRDASQIRLDREKHQEELEKLIGSIKNDAEQRYQKAENDALRFHDVTALQWPTLPEERRRVASGACRMFEQVQDFVLAEKKEKNPLEYARLLHYIGIFEYYADHNVDAALRYLSAADELFGETANKDFRVNQAYTKHFLGVIQKNWPLRNEPPGTSLKEAERFLQAAENFLTMESGQFLTALTHAEVLSYRRESRDEAKTKLDEIIQRIEELKENGKSNSSQDALLPRAYLMRGNLSWIGDAVDRASGDFLEATKLAPKNSYMQFSYAQTKASGRGALDLWQKGLSFHPKPPALEKPETITRVLIFGWGIIAANEAELPELVREYRTAFETLGSGLEREGRYSPRFFSPLTKELLSFDALQKQVNEHLEKKS